MSITDELREYVGNFYLFRYKDVRERLEAIADRIDAEHQRAEDEWKAKNGDTWLKGYGECRERLMEGNESIAADLESHGWMKLPVDADGVPIRVGDVMDGTCPSGKHVNGTVSAIGDGVFWLSNVQFALKPHYMHHCHAPTVEDVLTEFARECLTYATCVDDHEVQDAIEMYADKLRLADDGEEQ